MLVPLLFFWCDHGWRFGYIGGEPSGRLFSGHFFVFASVFANGLVGGGPVGELGSLTALYEKGAWWLLLLGKSSLVGLVGRGSLAGVLGSSAGLFDMLGNSNLLIASTISLLGCRVIMVSSGFFGLTSRGGTGGGKRKA